MPLTLYPNPHLRQAIVPALSLTLTLTLTPTLTPTPTPTLTSTSPRPHPDPNPGPDPDPNLAYGRSAGDAPSSELFREAQQAVVVSMKLDIFPRFIESKLYEDRSV